MTLTVWCYPTPFGAGAGAMRLRKLQAGMALTVHDSVTVTWVPGMHAPRITSLRGPGKAGRSDTSVLRALLSLLVPGAGVDNDAVATAVVARLAGTGVDPRFLQDAVTHFRPGSSALVVLSGDVDLDAVRPYVERGLVGRDVVLFHDEWPADAAARVRRTLAAGGLDPREGPDA